MVFDITKTFLLGGGRLEILRRKNVPVILLTLHEEPRGSHTGCIPMLLVLGSLLLNGFPGGLQQTHHVTTCSCWDSQQLGLPSSDQAAL